MAIENSGPHKVTGQASQPTPQRTIPPDAGNHQLAHAIRAANTAIFRASWEHPNTPGWAHHRRRSSIDHIVDCLLATAAYLIRTGSCKADHRSSWVAEQVAQGYMTEEERCRDGISSRVR
jgi:hypothetical protein